MSESPDSASLPSTLSQVNLMELDAIDDKEFDIPQIDTPPTLESILNETDDEEEAFVLEDTCVLNPENIDRYSCETASLTSSDSGDPAQIKRRKKTLDPQSNVHGSVLRHSLLKGISAQIVSAADKVDAGLPTAIAVSSVIAVGTSHGLALIFDGNQALRLCLGNKASGAEFGAVSALSINQDCSRLLCGFAKGQILMWDLANGKLLRTITDAHPPGTAILHVKFTDDPTLAVCNDSGGSVYELAFKRVMGMRSCDSRCLFSGSKGEVCYIEPLRAPVEFRDHPITNYSLLAMASLTKILVIGMKPSLKVWLTFPYGKSDPSSVPQLAWQFVSVQKTVNPILAFCKGDTVQFLMVKKEVTGMIHVVKQRLLQLDCDIISLCWINSRTLVIVDSREKLQVVDRASQETLETLDLEQVQLVYNSRHFKSLATGGNVSQALALVGEKACYQSVSSFSGQIVYLGTKSAHIMTLKTWRERLDCLLKQEHFVDALALAWAIHEGKAKAVVGLVGDPVKRKAVVGDKMVDIMFQLSEHTLKRCQEQANNLLMEQHFQEVVPVLVDYCLLLQRTDLLYNQLYGQLSDNIIAKGVFLESLEMYIINNRLGALPTPLLKDLFDHYHCTGMMSSLERCIVHLDVTSLDMEQVVQVCWENHLYDALIYVFNRGMNDYITPLEKCFAVIGPPLRSKAALTDEEVEVGNKLLVYISCCLAGRAYPLGNISEDLVVQVKNQVFDFLIRLHSAETSSSEEQLFPYIQTLLHFDTREFLNVLAMTFEDFKNDKQALEYQQRIVDILLQVMVENPDFTPSQVGGLFTFLARQLAKPDNTLFVNRNLFSQVLEFLCRPDDDSRHAERQQALLQLLQVGGVVQFDETSLLAMAEEAKFYQICEFLYEKKNLHDKILDCYLRDPLRKVEVFSYIHNLLSMPGYSAEDKNMVKVKALQQMKELVGLNQEKSADLALLHFNEELQQIVSQLQDDELTFKFLRSLLKSREDLGPGDDLPCELYEHQIQLMCRFAPDHLVNFLHSSHYRLDQALSITETHQHSEARAYLLQKKGDIHGAFTVLLEFLQGKLQLLTPDNSEEQTVKGDEEQWLEKKTLMTTLNDSLNDIINLLHSNSAKLDQAQKEVLWFLLLEATMAPHKKMKGLNTKHTSEALKELTMKVLNNMSSFISLPAIIQRILKDPVYSKAKLSEIQDLILGMLDTFNYEQTLLETTTSLLNHDLHWSLAHLRAAVTKGLHPRQDYCNICLQQYKKKQESIEEVIVFRCGHPYHSQCLQQKVCESTQEPQWSCFKCSSSEGRAGPATLPRTRRTNSLAQTRVTSLTYQAGSRPEGRELFVETTLDSQQEQSWDQLRCFYRGPSRLSIISELSLSQSQEKRDTLIPPGQGSFPLKLSPPPLLEE
ncbi:vacuolar protein sorting-associated protein 8 homolog [Synchiropus splendidus]|uniref:vacuolar protein sorting-associated protein 8 homolog n=1 Tax=Synchiropus splendidus TaxID=270530 RepID=UPI00237D698F|nr:vacuolar protein sorting-associated protein 8 homolog [Synchiropus splendidus]